MKRIVCLAMVLALAMGGTVFAADAPGDMTTFEKQVAEKLTKNQFMKTAQAGSTDMLLHDAYGRTVPIELEATPYINADGVLMAAAEDLGRFLGWGKTRQEYYWDEYGKRVAVSVENSVEWNQETGKIKIEVPWREVENFFAASTSPYAPSWVPYEEGEALEPWEGPVFWKDGKKMKKGKTFIEMTVGSNI